MLRRPGRPRRVSLNGPKAGFPETLVSGHADPGLLLMEGDDPAGIAAFIAAIAKHRHFERETDPPRV
jgi:catalase